MGIFVIHDIHEEIVLSFRRYKSYLGITENDNVNTMLDLEALYRIINLLPMPVWGLLVFAPGASFTKQWVFSLRIHEYQPRFVEGSLPWSRSQAANQMKRIGPLIVTT